MRMINNKIAQRLHSLLTPYSMQDSTYVEPI